VSVADQVNLPLIAKLRAAWVLLRVWLGRFPLSLIQLAMRIAIGATFFNSGRLKFNSFEFAVRLFEDEYQLPILDPIWAARLAMLTELTFPIFLFLGLATRLATLPLLAMVAVIEIFVYPQAWVEHLLWASVLVFLLTQGPGAFSLDHLLEQWRPSRGPSAGAANGP
jgi:putative oxidoreductase